MRVFAFLAAAFATVHVARADPQNQKDQIKETRNDAEDLDEYGFFDAADPAAEALLAGLTAAGVGIEVGESTSDTIQAIASTGALASQFLPPPYNVVAGTGFATLGAFIGAPEDVSNGQMLDFLYEAFREINLKLDNIQDDINEIIATLDVIRATTLYTSTVVSEINYRQLMEPFKEIDAEYKSLMNSYFPTNKNDSWPRFFNRAKRSCTNLESEVFDAFDPENVKQAVAFYEQGTNPDTDAKINNMGMCGSAFLFQYIMTVRQELFIMCTYAHHDDKDAGGDLDSENKRDWKLDENFHRSYNERYLQDLENYDRQILGATSQGGLGLADFTKMTARELNEGVGSLSKELGFCFRCDKTSQYCTGQPFNPFNWPTSSNRVQGDPNYSPNKNRLNNRQKCNAEDVSRPWPYYDMECLSKKDYGKQTSRCCREADDSPVNSGERCEYKCYYKKKCPNNLRPTQLRTYFASQVRKERDTTVKRDGNNRWMGCCSCACLTEDDYDDGDGFGGKKNDHNEFDRHCERTEKLYDPLENVLATSKELSKKDLKAYNSLPLSKNFRISCVDNEPEDNGSSTLAISSQREEFRIGDEGGSWFRATPKDYVTAITFTNNGSHKRDVRATYSSDLTGSANIWFAQGEKDQITDNDGNRVQPYSCTKGVEFGKYAVEIGNWRLSALVTQGRLTVNHENGRNSKVYRCNGKAYSNQSQYEGYVNSFGDPKCAFLTPRYLQLGSWRIGRWNDVDRHISVTHRNGQTVEMYREDGRTFGKNTGGNLWSSSERREGDNDILAGTDSGCEQVYQLEDDDCDRD